MSPERGAGVRAGVMALEDSGRVDFTRLRAERRRRLFEGMGSAGLDALILGRSANVRYAAGARQLWRAGTSPFAPMCVLVAATGRVHLLSVWDEGVPPEISRQELYGLFWNPGNLLQALAAIPGLPEAARVGTDSMTPMFAQLLPSVVGAAELEDAGPMLRAARERKTEDEIGCLTVAAALAEAGLAALEAALEPGVTERRLVGIYHEAMSRLGTPTVPSDSVAFATPRHGPVSFRHLATERPVGIGELVVLSPGALYAGYEAGLARTRVAGGSPPGGAEALAGRADRALEALVAACRPGSTGADLRRAWEETGEPLPSVPLAHGMGIGPEPPVVGWGRGDDAVLKEGNVLSVQAWVSAEGTGGHLERELVLVGPEGPEVLTRSRRGLG